MVGVIDIGSLLKQTESSVIILHRTLSFIIAKPQTENGIHVALDSRLLKPKSCRREILAYTNTIIIKSAKPQLPQCVSLRRPLLYPISGLRLILFDSAPVKIKHGKFSLCFTIALVSRFGIPLGSFIKVVAYHVLMPQFVLCFCIAIGCPLFQLSAHAATIEVRAHVRRILGRYRWVYTLYGFYFPRACLHVIFR